VGPQDKLQDDVRGTLELTGDKIETATVISISTKLVARNQYIHQVAKREFFFYVALVAVMCRTVLTMLDM
jgi:hypothetical protein